MNKKEILYFAPCGLDEGIGGSGRLKNMVDILQILDTKVKLISYLSLEKFDINFMVGKNLDITTITFPQKVHIFIKIFAVPLIFVIGLVNIRNKDIIISHAPHIASGFPALILSRLFRKPLIVDHMDIKDPSTPQFIFDLILKNSTVFTISHFLENEVKEKYGSQTIHMPIFIDTEFFKFSPKMKDKLKKELNLSSSETIIGYAGSFWHVEGVPYLIEAFKDLRKMHDNIKLIIIGGGNAPESDDVENIIETMGLKKDIILISRQPYGNMPNYLSICDIVCSPKINCEENIAANPIKIYEYMSMGLITVSSAVGEVNSVIKDNVNGFLVEPGNVSDLKNKLDYIINNLENMDKIKINARKLIIKEYSQKVFKIKINNILNF